MAISFVDRVPTYANRMKITPEAGSAYYATVERADSPITDGTPLNAETFNNMQKGFVPTSGGEMTGPITVVGTGYVAAEKKRTINDVEYMAAFGCGGWGGKGVVALELSQGGSVITRLELQTGGVYFRDAAGVRHAIVPSTAVPATVEG